MSRLWVRKIASKTSRESPFVDIICNYEEDPVPLYAEI